MKKILLLIVAFTLAISLAACGDDPITPALKAAITGIEENGVIEVKVGSADIDLGTINAKDANGDELSIIVVGIYDLDKIDDYNVTLKATDPNGLVISVNVILSVVAETCEENPEQEICKTVVDKARETYADLYNVDLDNNGTADWTEQELTIRIGYSYYGADDEMNSVFQNIEKFMAKYPKITVERDPLYSSGWEGGDDGLLLIQTAALEEGTLPDVFFNPKGAETYDKGMTLDLTPYFRTDDESIYVTDNAISGMITQDGKEIWGMPWQGVGPIAAINLTLLETLDIDAPSYDWTYEEYEDLRGEVELINQADQCVFPGIIDFSIFGPNYFDNVPNGYKGYNIETRQFEFAGAINYGTWLESVANEAKRGLHFYDLDEAALAQKNCTEINDSWLDGVRAVNTINLWSFNESITAMESNGQTIDIYPYPVAPTGGNTAVYTYHDYYSINKALEADTVKAEASYQLVKWLTYGQEGTESRWNLIDEMNILDENGVSPFMNGQLYLMDYIQGWPITNNPDVLKNHPFVEGFSANSGGLDAFNFNAFKELGFQNQLSNANPYPRQLPAFASVANDFDPWTIKDDMRDKGLNFANIATDVQVTMNEDLEKYLKYYNSQN
jgi:multiple sugar transport system substrate-binding protein